jgi:hypothetical protein
MADKKVSELTAITNVSGDDLLLVVNDPLGTPASRKITVSNLFANVVPATTHKGVTTFVANTSFTGTTMTVSANLVLGGTNVLNAVNDRMQVANTNVALATKAANSFVTANYVSNTTYQTFITDLAIVATTGVVNATTNANTPIIKVSTATGIQGTVGSAPSSNNSTTEGIAVGTIFYSNNYLYIATDVTTIKRVPLEVF